MEMSNMVVICELQHVQINSKESSKNAQRMIEFIISGVGLHISL